MDHFCPSYFALLGPPDQGKLLESVIPGRHLRILEAFRDKGVRYLLAGNTALTLHGVRPATAELELLVDPEPDNIRIFLEAMVSENIEPDDTGSLRHPEEGESGKTSIHVTLGGSAGGQAGNYEKLPLPFGEVCKRRVRLESGSWQIDLMSLEDVARMRSGSNEMADRRDDALPRGALLKTTGTRGRGDTGTR